MTPPLPLPLDAKAPDPVVRTTTIARSAPVASARLMDCHLLRQRDPGGRPPAITSRPCTNYGRSDGRVHRTVTTQRGTFSPMFSANGGPGAQMLDGLCCRPEVGKTVDRVEYLDIRTRRSGYRFVLERDVLVIGRSETNDIALTDDPSVSRGHAILERLPSGWEIRDLGSRNGTLVNGKRIWSDRLLHPGD